MLFGRIPRIPLDLALGRVEPADQKVDITKQLARNYKHAKEAADKAKLRHRIQYDKHRKNVSLKIGDMVLWKHDKIVDRTKGDIPKKFRSNVYGPFIIIGTISKNAFRLKHATTGEVINEAVNAEKLQKYYEN